MKTKIKNEFQNPDLIFGNENQKRKLKLKNRILKSITYVMAFIFIFSVCLLDSDTWIPYIVCFICMIWFVLFIIANKNYLINFENKY